MTKTKKDEKKAKNNIKKANSSKTSRKSKKELVKTKTSKKKGITKTSKIIFGVIFVCVSVTIVVLTLYAKEQDRLRFEAEEQERIRIDNVIANNEKMIYEFALEVGKKYFTLENYSITKCTLGENDSIDETNIEIEVHGYDKSNKLVNKKYQKVWLKEEERWDINEIYGLYMFSTNLIEIPDYILEEPNKKLAEDYYNIVPAKQRLINDLVKLGYSCSDTACTDTYHSGNNYSITKYDFKNKIYSYDFIKTDYATSEIYKEYNWGNNTGYYKYLSNFLMYRKDEVWIKYNDNMYSWSSTLSSSYFSESDALDDTKDVDELKDEFIKKCNGLKIDPKDL